MIIEYRTVYTEFPMEMIDHPGLFAAMRDHAEWYARDMHLELVEGPPRLRTDDRRFVGGYSLLAWPALRVFYSATEKEVTNEGSQVHCRSGSHCSSSVRSTGTGTGGMV